MHHPAAFSRDQLSFFLSQLAASATRCGESIGGQPAYSVTITEAGLAMLLAASGKLLVEPAAGKEDSRS